MSVLNIRGVPEELSNAVKISAVKAGIPIREFVIKSLSDSVGVKVKPKRKVADNRPAARPKAQRSEIRTGSRKSAAQPATEDAKPKGPKQEFCKHQLRFCRECPGFH